MFGNPFVKNVSKALDSVNLKYNVKDDNTITLSFSGQDFSDPTLQYIIRQNDSIMFITTSVYNVASQYIDDVLIKVNDFNYDLVHGSFDFNRSNGDLRFRTAIFQDDMKKIEKEDILRQSGLGLRVYGQFTDKFLDCFDRS